MKHLDSRVLIPTNTSQILKVCQGWRATQKNTWLNTCKACAFEWLFHTTCCHDRRFGSAGSPWVSYTSDLFDPMRSRSCKWLGPNGWCLCLSLLNRRRFSGNMMTIHFLVGTPCVLYSVQTQPVFGNEPNRFSENSSVQPKWSSEQIFRCLQLAGQGAE